MKKYNIWDKAFVSIKSNQDAYWLGFVFGGCTLRQRGDSFSICISSNVYENLKDLSEFLDFKGNIKCNDSYYVVFFSSKEIYNSLVQWGIPTSKRTLSVAFPLLDNKYIPYFICGYLDNNSSLCIANRRNGSISELRLEIRGPYHFLLPIKEFIEDDFQLNKHKRICKKTTNGSCSLTLTGYNVKNLLIKYYNGVDKIRHRNKELLVRVING